MEEIIINNDMKTKPSKQSPTTKIKAQNSLFWEEYTGGLFVTDYDAKVINDIADNWMKAMKNYMENKTYTNDEV